MKLAITILTAATAILTWNGGADAVAQKTWHFKQESKITGKTDIFINSRAVRIEDMTLHCVLLSTAPKWDVWFWNSQTRLAFHSPYDQFTSRRTKIYRIAGGGPSESCRIDLRRSLVKDKRYTFERVSYRIIPPRRGKQYASPSSIDDTYFLQGKLEAAVLPELAPKAVKLVNLFYSLPDAPDMPLFVKYVRTDTEKRVDLNTSSAVAEPDAAIAARFKPPTDCKLVKTEDEVLNTNTGQGAGIAQVLEFINSGEERNQQNQRKNQK